VSMSATGVSNANQAAAETPSPRTVGGSQLKGVREASPHLGATSQRTSRSERRGTGKSQQVVGRMGRSASGPRRERALSAGEFEEKRDFDLEGHEHDSGSPERSDMSAPGSPRSMSSLDLFSPTIRRATESKKAGSRAKPAQASQSQAGTAKSAQPKSSKKKPSRRRDKSSSTSATEGDVEPKAKPALVQVDPASQAPFTAASALQRMPTPRRGQSKIYDAFVVRECVDIWTNSADDRVLPREAGSPNFGPQQVLDRSTDVLDKFHEDGCWLKMFDLIRMTNPLMPRTALHSIKVDGLNDIEMISVLQSALYQAGYSFMNLVPAALRAMPELMALQMFEVETEVQVALFLLALEVEEWIRFRSVRPEDRSPTVSTHSAVDVYAMRHPQSILSSSDGLPGRPSSLRTSAFSLGRAERHAEELAALQSTQVRREGAAFGPAQPPPPHQPQVAQHQSQLAFQTLVAPTPGPVQSNFQPQAFVDPSSYRFQQPAVAPGTRVDYVPYQAPTSPTQALPSAFDDPMRASGPAPAFPAAQVVTQAASMPIARAPAVAPARPNQEANVMMVNGDSFASHGARSDPVASARPPPPSFRPFIPNKYLDKFSGSRVAG
jgi:hypothetical protein